MPFARAVEASSIVAALGPTNTGKTHRAIERMLEHPSGMIGLPLRLLAREVYDRVSARLGEARVALLTGEEKRIPRRPAYWVCTVEAMPMDRDVDFVAVDEIQLCAHRERGHVFTDRLLHARGRYETWFLGSDTMRPLLQRLVPTAAHRHLERFSQLRHVPHRSLKGLPPRSAVVAFSVPHVYEMAERIRRLRGGVAVVLGALSPRTRNAQVAMYQAGEVQYLVATDAIGMGLNLDVDHIAFASREKFDGRQQRALEADELAQIAGRAGRHLNDGTFGMLRPVPELPQAVADAIECHRFAPLRRLVWRSSDLDFSSIDALVESLLTSPFHAALRRVEHADDFDALKTLAKLPDVRAAARGSREVALLWEVCQIPDFRRLLLHRHAATLLEIFRQLVRGDGRLDDEWLNAQIIRVDDLSGGIDELTARLAAVRTWTYVSHRTAWLRDPAYWQERTRSIEDALGDALHQRLVERFVERAGAAPRRRFRPVDDHAAARVASGSGPFAQLRELAEAMAPGGEEPTEADFVQAVIEAAHDDFGIDRAGHVWFRGARLGRLVRGKELLLPAVVLDAPEAYGAGSRAQLERRLVALGRDLATEAAGGFRADACEIRDPSAEARGLAYRLDRAVGVLPKHEARAQWRAMPEPARRSFEAQGVRAGHRFLYVCDALCPRALERRATLVSLWLDAPIPEGVPVEPQVPGRSFRGTEEARLYAYERAGPTALRVDVLERVMSERPITDAASGPPALLHQLGLDDKALSLVLAALGRDGERRDAGVGASRRQRRRRRHPSRDNRPGSGPGG